MKQLSILKKDKKLAPIVAQHKVYALRVEKDLYFTLLRSIVSQQLSVKAADTIFNRFLLLFRDQYPHAKQLAKMPDEKLRKAGLSQQKAGYLKNIAQFALEFPMDFKTFKQMKDEEIIAHLTQIKGVGQWTVEMLLMFALGRENVFPVNDLGIINGMKKIYGLKTEGKALKNKCLALSKQWEPYRSYACLYIWAHKDNN
jgi:DNA-3-methyladenine glycosylase II